MRVIAGAFKNRILISCPDRTIRPAMDRVKTFIFDVLGGQVSGGRVCDLFAGSGSLGIEALSRGAAQVDFVDLSSKSVQTIHKNLMSLSILDSARVHREDAVRFVRRCREPYDLIFCDPPYEYTKTPEIILDIFSHSLLRPDGILVVEHTLDKEWENRLSPLSPFRQKKFGRTIMSFFGEMAHSNREENH